MFEKISEKEINIFSKNSFIATITHLPGDGRCVGIIAMTDRGGLKNNIGISYFDWAYDRIRSFKEYSICNYLSVIQQYHLDDFHFSDDCKNNIKIANKKIFDFLPEGVHYNIFTFDGYEKIEDLMDFPDGTYVFIEKR